jgi:hypothetical protein
MARPQDVVADPSVYQNINFDYWSAASYDIVPFTVVSFKDGDCFGIEVNVALSLYRCQSYPLRADNRAGWPPSGLHK